MDDQPMRCGVRASIVVSLAGLLVFLQLAYANGEHIHVGGLFLVLLGAMVFLGSVVVVVYFLLRSHADGAQEEHDRGE